MTKITLSDIMLKPSKLVEGIRKFEKGYFARTFAILLIMSAIVGMIYAGLFSEEKFYLLRNVITMPLGMFVTLLCVAPVMLLISRIFVGDASTFKSSIAIITTAFTYGFLTLLLTAPLYILTSLNDFYTGKNVFNALVLIGVVVVILMFGKLTANVYRLEFYKAVIIVAIVGIYTLLIYVNVMELLSPYAVELFYYRGPVFETAAKMSIV